MQRSLVLATLLALGGLGWAAGTLLVRAAAQSTAQQAAVARTRTFAIENITCALCPVTVKKAIEGVAGVKSVAADFDAETATVAFDPSVTDEAAIAAASTDAGYRASVEGRGRCGTRRSSRPGPSAR